MSIIKNSYLLLIILVALSNKQSYSQTDDYHKSLNNYSFGLYNKIKVENENAFLSPLSSYYTLLMGYEGSKGITRQEFVKVLNLDESSNMNIQYLHGLAFESDSSSILKVSNSIWADKNLNLEEVYINSIKDKYHSDIKRPFFVNKDSTISEINDWVARNTNHKITRIINARNVDPDTKLLIIDAVYFNGEWSNKFIGRNTRSAPFYTSIDNQYNVHLMNIIENLQYYENDLLQFISKPYKDSDLSFCVILPKDIFGIGKVENRLNTDYLNLLLDSTYKTKVSLSLPKLELESSLKLKEALNKMGLNSAFSRNADFSGISRDTSLMLGQVLHKAWIGLDEYKTESAAATSTGIRIIGLPSYKIFNADHPFVFLIIDNRTRGIIFIGRYFEPVGYERIQGGLESLTKKLENRRKEKFSVGNESKNLIIVDNKIFSHAEFARINPKEIESIELVRDEKEMRKYSKERYDAVIVVRLIKKRGKRRDKK